MTYIHAVGVHDLYVHPSSCRSHWFRSGSRWKKAVIRIRWLVIGSLPKEGRLGVKAPDCYNTVTETEFYNLIVITIFLYVSENILPLKHGISDETWYFRWNFIYYVDLGISSGTWYTSNFSRGKWGLISVDRPTTLVESQSTFSILMETQHGSQYGVSGSNFTGFKQIRY